MANPKLFLVTSIVEIRLKSHDKFNNLEVSKQIQWPIQPGLSSNPTWPIASVNHHAFTILPSRNSLTFHCINHWKWWPFGLRLGLFPQFQTALAKLWFSGMAVGLRGCVVKRGCDAESKSGYRWYRLMCPERFAVRTERKHAMQHYFTIPVPPRFTWCLWNQLRDFDDLAWQFQLFRVCLAKLNHLKCFAFLSSISCHHEGWIHGSIHGPGSVCLHCLHVGPKKMSPSGWINNNVILLSALTNSLTFKIAPEKGPF